MKTCFYIVPAWSDQAGKCRIVSRTHEHVPDAARHYRQFPEQWTEAGLMNSQGGLVALSASKAVFQELKDSEPLAAGVCWTFDAAEAEPEQAPRREAPRG